MSGIYITVYISTLNGAQSCVVLLIVVAPIKNNFSCVSNKMKALDALKKTVLNGATTFSIMTFSIKINEM